MFQWLYCTAYCSKRHSYQLALARAINAYQHSMSSTRYYFAAKVDRHVACCCISTPLPRSRRTARAARWHMRGDAID
jgi:hypothetical protein